jgi:hypothetical protein
MVESILEEEALARKGQWNSLSHQMKIKFLRFPQQDTITTSLTTFLDFSPSSPCVSTYPSLSPPDTRLSTRPSSDLFTLAQDFHSKLIAQVLNFT